MCRIFITPKLYQLYFYINCLYISHTMPTAGCKLIVNTLQKIYRDFFFAAFSLYIFSSAILVTASMEDISPPFTEQYPQLQSTL